MISYTATQAKTHFSKLLDPGQREPGGVEPAIGCYALAASFKDFDK